MKFFKHLAAVLAAAMIITLIPAQTANAAKYSKLAFQEATSSSQCITSFELAKGKTRDLKFYGVGDYRTTGIGWSSSNDAVATVDKNGIVKAVGVGSAQITYSAKGYISIPTTVVVTTTDYNVYIAEQNSGMRYTSYNLMLGKTVDFKFVGAKGWSTSLYSASWNTTDDSVATVDNYGIVTPVKIGTCQIVLTIIEKKTGKVAYAVQPVTINVKSATPTATPTPKATATPTATPTPKAGFSVQQTSYNQAVVTFGNTAIKDSAISLTCDENPIMETSKVENGKVTITFVIPLENGKEYTIRNSGSTDNFKFKAVVGSAVTVGLAYDCLGEENKAYPGEKVNLHPQVLDANGIVLDQVPEVELEYDGLSFPMYEDYITASDRVGTTYRITVKSYSATGSVIQKVYTITVVNKPAYAVSKIEAKLVETGESYSSKNATGLSLCIGDETKGISIRYSDNRGNTNKETIVGEEAVVGKDGDVYGYFTFTSSNENVLVVDDNGAILPLKQGSATITVTFVDIDSDPIRRSTVGSFIVSVGAARQISSITKTYKSAQNNTLCVQPGADDYNKMVITYTFKDQNGSLIDPATIELDTYTVKSTTDVTSNFTVTSDVDSDKKELYLTVTVRSNPIASGKQTTVYLITNWLYNTDYNTRAKQDTTNRITIIDTTAGSPTPTYVAMWSQDSAKSLGLSAGGGDLEISAYLIESKNGGYADAVTAITPVPAQPTYGAGDVGHYFYEVTKSGTNKSKDYIKNTSATLLNGKVTVPVRAAFGALGESDLKSAENLASIGVVTVTINFYQVKQGGTTNNPTYKAQKIASLSKTLKNEDPSSSATVAITNNTTEYAIDSEGGWIDWLQEHATIVIKNGITGETYTVNAQKSFDSYGILAVPNFSTNTTYLKGLDLYLPDKAGSGYVKLKVSITANPKVQNR
jgi:hypothetical protein